MPEPASQSAVAAHDGSQCLCYDDEPTSGRPDWFVRQFTSSPAPPQSRDLAVNEAERQVGAV